MDDITTVIQVPLAVDAVNIPVLAGGGVGDGRGFLAALSLGASGVVMGTRFMATKECQIHPNVKQALTQAQATDTVPVLRSLKSMERVLKNDLSLRVVEMENKGTTLAELIPLITGEKSLSAWESGDVDKGLIGCGQVIGLISEVKSVREVIDGIVGEARSILEHLCTLTR